MLLLTCRQLHSIPLRICTQSNRLGLTIGCCISLLLLVSTQVHAESVWNVAVTPPNAYVQAKLGTKTVHVITLENTGTKEVTLQPKIVDFLPDGQTGQPILQEFTSFPYLDKPADKLAPLTIPAGQRTQFSLVLEPPPDAPEKEWPLTVLFSQTTSQSEIPSMVASAPDEVSHTRVNATIGSNIVVLVSNQSQLPYVLTLDSVNIPKLVDSFRDLTFDVLLKNQGIAAVAASGSAQVVNMFGKTIYQADIYPDTILGLSQRAARALGRTSSSQLLQSPDTAAPLPVPQPTPFTLNHHLLLGPYRLIITLKSPLSGSTDQTTTTTFYALPFILLMCIGLAGGAAALYVILKHRW